MDHRQLARAAAVIPLALAVGVTLVSPAAAAPAAATVTAAAPGSNQFTEALRTAGRAVAPSATVGAVKDSTYPSAYDATLSVRTTTGKIRLGDRAVITVVRQVGAQPAITADSVRGAGRAEATVALGRPAGKVEGYVATSGSGAERGLVSLSWNERPGVTYIVLGRGEVEQSTLETVARALPADASAATARELETIRTGVIDNGTDIGTPGGITPFGGSRLYVDNDGPAAPDDDWRNEREQCNTNCSHRFSNFTLLWQAVLWSDMAEFGFEDMDCDFGSYTALVTSWWQDDFSDTLVTDGRAGPNTHDRADDFLYVIGPQPSGDMVGYSGWFLDFRMHRWGGSHSSPHLYDLELPDSNFNPEWHGTWYQTANFSHC